MLLHPFVNPKNFGQGTFKNKVFSSLNCGQEQVSMTQDYRASSALLQKSKHKHAPSPPLPSNGGGEGLSGVQGNTVIILCLRNNVMAALLITSSKWAALC